MLITRRENLDENGTTRTPWAPDWWSDSKPDRKGSEQCVCLASQVRMLEPRDDRSIAFPSLTIYCEQNGTEGAGLSKRAERAAQKAEQGRAEPTTARQTPASAGRTVLDSRSRTNPGRARANGDKRIMKNRPSRPTARAAGT